MLPCCHVAVPAYLRGDYCVCSPCRKRLDEGDVEAAQLAGGQARLSHTSNKNETVTTVSHNSAPPMKPSAFSEYFSQRAKQEDRRFEHEIQFQNLLMSREKLESNRLSMQTKKQKIELLERKLKTMTQQNRTDTPLFIALQKQVDKLYLELCL